METYHKISTPFKRDMDGSITGQKGKLIVGDWARPEFEYLADNRWEFTEKVDGTNIRVEYTPNDGLDKCNVFFAGRTDRAVIPSPLMAALRETFTTDRFHRGGFVEDGVTLFGEGYGPKIQGGGKYRDDHSFVLFDVKISDFWLDRENVNDIASKLGIESVPVIGRGTLWEAIRLVRGEVVGYATPLDGPCEEIQNPPLKSEWGDFEAEGLVCRPIVPLFNRKSERIICKVKSVDFK